MRFDLLESDCKHFLLINARSNGSLYLRAGILLCVNAKEPVATFTLSDRVFQLLIPSECLDFSQVTKTYNLDIAILSQNEQVRLPR